ncbi:MAG: FG-GAP-like repeat-containing protein [candidate division KSB1 bacterium]|nr:FG-GAP-like repeat-containing protein [candidate division KSB1 bacterium]MDZ7301195.1 FG-GAP-like repeat-containing protein [candidate division KSB1 bacterium]MDZ7310581.1 FG-GAP-like repeat-containing protein [candidate division KSB1 bacterium]
MPRCTKGLLCFWLCAPLIFFSIAFAFNPQSSDRKFLKSHLRHSQPSERLQLKSRTDSAAADTLDILAIRVDFQPDTIAQTTGNGRFMLSRSDKYTIDPPPHDRAYFEAQLLALKNYYASVSAGKLILRYQVFPIAEAEAYHLDRPMSYYAPGRKDPNSDKRLAELFRDGFQKAEAADPIDFSRFDSFILFHAGVGEDFAESGDPTTNDIPSAFLTLEDLRKNLANGDPNYKGIAVRGGSFHIPDGLILPETQTREIPGSGLFEFGLLGTAALMFGHQIGLPNLFNTDNGAAGIGYWGLMDQGSNNYQGLLPAQPEAWSKVFLGWEKPIVVTQGENFEIAAALHENPNKIYKIPITDSEYFLLENRQRDVNGDRIASGRDVNGTRIEFKETGFIAAQAIGVITQVDEYDFGLPYAVDENNRILPGCGILIWHIDEEVIRKNYASNRVNTNPDHRGIDLEEADGAQDIGRFYSLLDPGSGSENGVPEDAWWKSNPVITKYLRPDQPVEFGPTTMPSTASNSGAYTGIVITNFSDLKPVMTFSVRNTFAVPNFPQYVSGKPNALPPMLADLTGDGKLDIVIATTKGDIFAWQADGRKVIDNLDTETLAQPNGLTVTVPKATFASLGDSLFAPPVLVDLNGDRSAEVITAGKDGRLRAWRASDRDLDDRADLLWQFDLGAPCRANITVRTDSGLIFCGAENGKLFGLGFNGAKRWEALHTHPIRGLSLWGPNLIVIASFTGGLAYSDNQGHLFVRVANAPVVSTQIGSLFDAVAIADLNNNGGFEFIVRDDEGKLYISGLDTPTHLPGQEKSGVAVGDINNDGRKEIVLVSKNQLYAYNLNGVLTENFPLQISTTPSAKTPYSITPIIADADGDGVQDVIVNGVDGNVYAYHGNGTTVPGFPLAMSGPGRGSLAVADLDGDGHLELIGISGNGYVHVWHLPASSNKADWPMYHHDAAQTSLNAAQEKPVVATGKLMPSNLVYNYPNPTEGNSTTIRYRLNDDAQVKISIYDTAGDLVEEFSGPGLAQADNEVVWNLSDVQSGVYLARVEAKGASETSVAIIKIAVVK